MPHTASARNERVSAIRGGPFGRNARVAREPYRFLGFQPAVAPPKIDKK